MGYPQARWMVEFMENLKVSRDGWWTGETPMTEETSTYVIMII